MLGHAISLTFDLSAKIFRNVKLANILYSEKILQSA